jgi:hypothetical protein
MILDDPISDVAVPEAMHKLPAKVAGEYAAMTIDPDIRFRPESTRESHNLFTAPIQNTTLMTRMMSSSGEKTVSRRGKKGAAVTAAIRVMS